MHEEDGWTGRAAFSGVARAGGGAGYSLTDKRFESGTAVDEVGAGRHGAATVALV